MNVQTRYTKTSDGVGIAYRATGGGMARSSAGVEFEDRDEQEMKGVGEPVRVYAVRVQS